MIWFDIHFFFLNERSDFCQFIMLNAFVKVAHHKMKNKNNLSPKNKCRWTHQNTSLKFWFLSTMSHTLSIKVKAFKIISGCHWWLTTKLFLLLYFLPTIHRWLTLEETLSFVTKLIYNYMKLIVICNLLFFCNYLWTLTILYQFCKHIVTNGFFILPIQGIITMPKSPIHDSIHD